MRKEDIEDIARTAAMAVITQRKDIMQEEFDTRYHDVKLLMKNYRKLKAHYAKVPSEAMEVDVICSMRRKTGLMMGHVDKMLSAYKALCEGSGEPNEEKRWTALYLRYIAEERISIDVIAAQMEIDRRTFYRYIEKAFEDMAVLLFGIEAIGTWKPKNNGRKE